MTKSLFVYMWSEIILNEQIVRNIELDSYNMTFDDTININTYVVIPI